ncbi:MAG: hypothetical protein AAB865_01635 [Patescibacteria group bacterium]
MSYEEMILGSLPFGDDDGYGDGTVAGDDEDEVELDEDEEAEEGEEEEDEEEAM